MGNNYEKNFSKNTRKILVLGIENSGKTSNFTPHTNINKINKTYRICRMCKWQRIR
jgi:hypothetical protein